MRRYPGSPPLPLPLNSLSLQVTLGTAFAALCEGLNRGHTMLHGGEGRVARWDDVKVRPCAGVCCVCSCVVDTLVDGA